MKASIAALNICGLIVTNPPFRYALEFVQKSLDLIPEGRKVAMFLRIQFLEGKVRRKFFDEHPSKTVYVATSRIKCAMNGDFGSTKGSCAICLVRLAEGLEGGDCG